MAPLAVWREYSPPSQRRLRISRGPCHALPSDFTFVPSFNVVPLGEMLNSVTVCQLATGAGAVAVEAINPTARQFGRVHQLSRGPMHVRHDASFALEVAVQHYGRRFLELNDMWAPVVIQMGRAADYKSFEDFCAAVKANRFEYTDGKLTYVSHASETFEYWSKGAPPPRINGTEVNLNPPKTFDSPFLSMEHGTSKAVITYPGQKDVVLDFNKQSN